MKRLIVTLCTLLSIAALMVGCDLGRPGANAAIATLDPAFANPGSGPVQLCTDNFCCSGSVCRALNGEAAETLRANCAENGGVALDLDQEPGNEACDYDP